MGEDWRGGYGRRSLERLNRRLAMGQVRNQPDSPILPPDIPGLVLWLRSDLGVTAVMSAVVPTGTAPPVVTLTGTPSPLLSVEIDITTPGLRGIALFQWKLGGAVQQTGLVTGANVALGTGTLAAQFTGGASVYVADNVYTATVQVSAWADQSGAGNSVLQGAVANQPAYGPTSGPNGTPALAFAGAQFIGRNSSVASATAMTIFAVLLTTTTAAQQTYVIVGNSNGIGPHNDANGNRALLLSGVAVDDDGPSVANTWEAWAVSCTGVSSQTMRVNGASQALAQGTPLAASGGTTIGAASNGASNFLQGKIAETIIYNRALAASEIFSVETYIRARTAIW